MAVAVAAGGLALGFPAQFGSAFGPGFFPFVLSLTWFMCSLAIVVRAVQGASAANPPAKDEVQLGQVVRFLALLVAGAVLFLLALPYAGFILSMFAVAFLVSYAVRRDLMRSLAVSLFTAGLMEVVFVRLLHVTMPGGIFG